MPDSVHEKRPRITATREKTYCLRFKCFSVGRGKYLFFFFSFGLTHGARETSRRWISRIALAAHRRGARPHKAISTTFERGTYYTTARPPYAVKQPYWSVRPENKSCPRPNDRLGGEGRGGVSNSSTTTTTAAVRKTGKSVLSPARIHTRRDVIGTNPRRPCGKQ